MSKPKRTLVYGHLRQALRDAVKGRKFDPKKTPHKKFDSRQA